MRLDENQQADLPGIQRLVEGKKRLQDGEDACAYGTAMDGPVSAGIVLEVRKGNFLTELFEAPEMPAGTPPCPRIVRTSPRGMLEQFDLGISALVAAGDEVEVVVPPVSGAFEHEAVLTRVRSRRSHFRRLHPSGRAIQTLAANVDQVLVVGSAQEPVFRPGFVDRVLVCAQTSDLPTLLVLNKIDLGVTQETLDLLEVYRGLGLPVLKTSILDTGSLEALRAALVGKTSVLCGHSGVGKSSLLVALAPELSPHVRMGEVSAYSSKGKHTTTHARLFRACGATIIDTPGVRELTPVDTDRRNLWGWFPEIASRQGQCAFADCTHIVEKKCAILTAVAAGSIHPRRHESYVRIYETLPS